ncbi:MAG: histidine kinase [Bacteroidetes bacterium]|nr:MAG: histidine kinase [Bacteroidota bacterium]
MKKQLVLFLLSLIFFSTLYGQGLNSNLRFGRLSVDKGLSQSKVYCSYQDNQGFMWFGTEDGLNKYDGYSFEVYKHNPTDEKAISNNIIRCIFEDSKNNLLIGTDNGLNIYQRSNGSFKRYQNRPGDNNSISDNIISSVCEDKNGIIWVGTSKGLNSFDISSEKFSLAPSQLSMPGTLSSPAISSLLLDKNGTLWVGTVAHGLNAFDVSTRKSVRYLHNQNNQNTLSENEITCLKEDKSGNIWAGTVNGGINIINTKTGKITHLTQENGLSSNSVFSILLDVNGNTWIGTLGGGLNAIDIHSGRKYTYLSNAQNSESLSNNKVWNLFEDNAGTIWISTSEGLSFYNRTLAKFNTYQPNPVSGGNNSVFSVYEDENENIWVGVLGGGLNVFDRKEEKFVPEKFASLNQPLLRFNNIFSITGDKKGILWLGTTDGLISYDKNKGTVRQFKSDPSNPSSISNNYVRSIYIDKDGLIWIGTHGGGLNVFNPQTEKFSAFRNKASDPTSLSNDVVMNVYEDRQGSLWIATYGGGLNQMDKRTGKFKSFQNDINNKASINSNFIHSVYEDSKGLLWIGTYGGGINLLKPGNPNFLHYTENDGLPNNIVNGFSPDAKGSLWISTNSGVCKLNPRSLESKIVASARIYNQEDGLQNKFNENACFTGANGWLYFGGNQGLNAFHPDSINDNKVVPPVVITRFYLFEKPARMDTLITNERTLKLNYKQNFFTFEFAGLNYLLPEKNRYAYKMEGLNDEWVEFGTRRYVTFTNVDPDHYVFKVKACNNDGVWNEAGISIDITITPPFWKTWWFTGLSALAITLLIFTYIRIRTNTLVKQNVLLEEKVHVRTHELQEKNVELTMTMDNLKSTQNQLIQSEKMASLGQLTAGIAHEIQNPLNFVNNFSELSVELLEEFGTAPEEEKKEIVGDLKQNLGKIVFHGKRADSIVKGMLQHSRASTAEKQVTDINKLVEEFFNLAYHGMRAKDPAFNCTMQKDLAPDIPQIKIIPQDISRVILNIFNNSFYAVDEKKKISHSADYQPVVSITTKKLNGQVLISVRDNGKGISAEIRDKIFNPFFTTKPTGMGTGLGLSISYDIVVKGHGGDIKVDSKPGEYTEFTILLPILT